MAVSKILLAKSFVALSTTSAIGTGAFKFFSTKGITERVNEELRKKFEGKTNRQVLEIAGFKDASTDRNILKKSLELRLTSQKVTDELVGKLEKFCEEGMKVTFEGITEVYKTLATVCSRTILLESKVKRDNLVLSKDADISEKLNQITDNHREREFINSLKNETAEELVKACEKFGSKDVFSYEVTKETLADYMTFCVEEKPSVIRFWTGVDTPSEIVDYWVKKEAEEKKAREEEQARKAQEAERQRLADIEAEKQKKLELERQQAEEQRLAKEAADLKAKQEREEQEAAALKAKQEEDERKRKAEAQRQEDIKTAKQKLTSWGFRINGSGAECEDKLQNLKENVDSLKEVVKACYKNKKFSDRVKEWGLGVFDSETKMHLLSLWWNSAKLKVGNLIPGVNSGSNWNNVKDKVKNYCMSSNANKKIDDQTTDADWKAYVSLCTMRGFFYTDSDGSTRTNEFRSRNFWNISPLP